MKRLILYLVATLLTFAFGVGFDKLAWRRPVEKAPAAKAEPVSFDSPQPQTFVPPAAPPAPEPPPIPYMIADFDPEEFNAVAEFNPIGAVPKGFASFYSIEVDVSGNRHDPGYIQVRIRMDDNDNYDSAAAVFGIVSEKRLFFATSTMSSGVEYHFDGKFLRKDFSSFYDKDKAVLRGTLTKTKDGRKIAEGVLSFRVTSLGC